MQHTFKLGIVPLIAAILIFASACGKAKKELTGLSNQSNLPGYWLINESEHANPLQRAAEKESVVLVIRDGKVAFSPTDGKGEFVFKALSTCFAGPRPYRVEGSDLIFEPVAACPEVRTKIQELSDTVLKFPDPVTPDITRVFTRIDQPRYYQLVKASERRY